MASLTDRFVAFVRARNVHVGALLLVLFVAGATFSEFYVLSTVIQSVTMAVAGAVVVGFGPYALQSFTSRNMTRTDYLILGITLAWFGAFGRSAFTIYWRLGENGGLPISSYWVSFCNAMIMIGGVLHLLAPQVIGDEIPPRGWVILGATLGLGITVAWVVLLLSLR